MTCDEQLEQWCVGNSVHNHERDECCPDFSCCNPAAAAPMEERILFRDRPELRDAMLMGFLGRALAGAPVHIVGSIGGEA
jgi:hypothetical protein